MNICVSWYVPHNRIDVWYIWLGTLECEHFLFVTRDMGLQGYDLWYVCLRWDRGVINDAVVSPRLWLHDVNCEVGGAPRTELASWVARLVLGRLEEKVQSPIWPRQATPLHLLALMKAVKVPSVKLENDEHGCSLPDLSRNLPSAVFDPAPEQI